MWQHALLALDRPRDLFEVSHQIDTSLTVARIAMSVLLKHAAAIEHEDGRYERTLAGEMYLREIDSRDVPADMQPDVVPLTTAEETLAHARQYVVTSVWGLAG
jgi:hypothetical protein